MAFKKTYLNRWHIIMYWAVSLCLNLAVNMLVAQQEFYLKENLKFKNFSTSDGLSQRSVSCIVQDRQGFLWFGTRYGLNKYDGISFKPFSYNSEDPNSLSHNWITDLVLDTQGLLWIGTKNGLNRYNTKDNSITRIERINSDSEDYNPEIWAIAAQDSSYLWVSTNNGLDRFNTKTNYVLHYNQNKNNPNSISSNKTRRVLLMPNGDLWVCTDEKIDRLRHNSNTFEHFEYPNNANPKITKYHTLALFRDRNGVIWLGYNKGLAYFNVSTSSFEDFKIQNKPAITSSVRTICEDKEGYLWVGAYDGLYKLNLEKNKVSKYQHDVSNPKSLGQNSVYKIIEDSRGDLWIGTWAGGVSYYDKSSNDFVTFSEGFLNKNLNYKVVSSFIEDENENLWIGTEGGGINFYDKSKGTFTYITNNPRDLNSLSANNVKAMLRDHSGHFWIGTHDGGLNQLIVKGSKITVKRFPVVSESMFSQEDNRTTSLLKITSLAEDDYYKIWIGTNEGGLNYYNTSENRFYRLKDTQNNLGAFIYAIIKSKFGNSLFIGSESGLCKVNPNTFEVKNINFRGNSKISNNVTPVISLYEESATSIWIGTEGDGVYNYNTITGESQRFGLKDGLPNEVIYGILPDDYNNIWLSTNKGICRFNLNTKTLRNFDELDGLQGNEFNYGAYHKNKNGNLVFGGVNGFTAFNPGEIGADGFIPPIAITSLSVRNKHFKVITDSVRHISLRYNQNDFSFNFVALNYSQPNKNQYAYKLEGFDSDWNYIGNNTTAVYTNINHGNYRFMVKASNSDGIWNENGPVIYIDISPPLWKTWWAYVLYVMLFVSVFWFIRRYELIRIKNRNELRQERLDKEQMEEVNRLKLQLFTNISHDFRTPLTLIIGPLRKLINDNKADNILHKQLSGMYRNANILLQLINQLLDFRKSEAGKLKLHTSKYNIVAFLENTKLSFDELAKDKNITYTFSSGSDKIDVWFDKIEMKKVILNILSNAFKFTPSNGSIDIRVNVDPKNAHFVKVEIQDSGKGIPFEDIKFVFDRYFQLGQQNELRSGTGVGLALAKDIVDLHKGDIFVESTIGKGSCFTVLLSLGNEHLKQEEIFHESLEENDSIDYYDVKHVASGWVKGEVSDAKPLTINTSLPNILLVEDNMEVRQFIAGIFVEEFNVFEAENGSMGINMAQLYPIDVIVSDIMMPEMDGTEMCHQLKSDIKTCHIPVILLTARTSSKIQKVGYETGADVYLTKPFDAATLKIQVANILNSRKNLINKFKKDILIEPKEITVVSTDELFLKNAMQVIEDNLENPEFNVNEFTDKMFMSQSVLYRKIKALTGQSISEFIRTVRLKKAGKLLKQTDMSVADIAYDTGFTDLKYFRKCFKTVFGVTPTEYKKQTS